MKSTLLYSSTYTLLPLPLHPPHPLPSLLTLPLHLLHLQLIPQHQIPVPLSYTTLAIPLPPIHTQISVHMQHLIYVDLAWLVVVKLSYLVISVIIMTLIHYYMMTIVLHFYTNDIIHYM